MLLSKAEYSKAESLVKTLNLICSSGKSDKGPFGIQKQEASAEKEKKSKVRCSFFFALPQFGIRLELSKLPDLTGKS